MKQIYSKEGFSAFFRGLGPNVTRAMLMNASQLASYDFFKQFLLRTGYFKDNMVTHFNAGLMAGFVATAICSPTDVLKSRVRGNSFLRCGRSG